MGTEWVRRALVVEDQAALRTLVVEMLAREGWQAVGAANAVDASRLFTQFDPDVLVTDIDLGSRPTGAELALMLAQLAPHMGIVFLTSYPRAAAGAKAMGIPHAVFIAKQELASSGELIAALETALSTHAAHSVPVADREGLGRLTKHQLDVLAMIARGWSNEQIAHSSGATLRAVERSISRIFDRLGVTGDAARNPRVTVATMYLAVFGPAR